MDKITVAVLFGGVSSEHEVSRMTVASLLQNIDREAFEPVPVGITKDGRWFLYPGDTAAIAGGEWEKDPRNLPAVLSPDRSHKGLLVLEGDRWRPLPVDVIFPALHGQNGEDGTLQGFAAMAGIPCVGSGVLGSADCMDKDVAKTILTAHGIPVARWFLAFREDRDDDAIASMVSERLGWPVFVKPANAGSSVGVSRAEDPAALSGALDAAFALDRKVLIEKAIQGAEVECAVMGNYRDVRPSDCLGEIVPKRGLYDYEGKYLDGSTDLYIPARIPEETAEAIRKTAIQAYQVLECRGLCRIDFFVRESDGAILLNEPNTLPGFTAISMYPKLWEATGLPYSELLHRLIRLAQAMDG